MWVKVPEIPANGDAGITMWYGNPNVRAESDGGDTFIDYDENEVVGSFSTNMKNSNGFIINAKVIVTALQKEGPQIIFDITGSGSEQTNIDYYKYGNCLRRFDYTVVGHPRGIINLQSKSCTYPLTIERMWEIKVKDHDYWFFLDNNFQLSEKNLPYSHGTIYFGGWSAGDSGEFKWIFVRKYASPEPTVALAPPAPATHTALVITKSPAPHSIRQFQETTITIAIENSGTTDAIDIEITDTIHPSFDLTSGDFPNPKRYDLIRPGETRDLQYTISAKESGTFTLDPATVTYADEDGNIQEALSEPVSIKVIPSTEGGTSGGTPRNPSVSTASVQLHGEKTNVVLGEDILLKLSAVNLITKLTMHVQVIIIPPSGMSVTSSAFAKSGAGQYTTTYELEPGTGKDIEVAIRSNQVGDFDVNGRIIYYFGDDRDGAEDHTLTLPITVRAEAEPGVGPTAGKSESEGSSTPGFAAVVAAAGVLLVASLIKRRRLR